MILDNDFKAKTNMLFPGLFNEVTEVDNANTLGSTEALWKTVSDKWVDLTRKKIAPIRDFITDVYPDMQVANPNANPIMQIEVVESIGDALVDAENFKQTGIQNKYVTCELHHISRPFSLSMYDITRGERIESKLAAAAESVLQGVYAQFVTAAKGAGEATELAAMSPATAVEISAAFGAQAETHTLILDPANYAKLVPQNGQSLNPDAEGTYGIGKIWKSYIDGGTTEGIAVTRDGVVGAIATKEVFDGLPGTSVRQINVGGIPMLVLATFDFDKHNIKVCVETWAGFAVTDNSRVKTYTFQDSSAAQD